MSQIVDWEYYCSLFDKVKQGDFAKAELRAEREVCKVIGPIRWATITTNTFGYEQLKDCICEVINKNAENEILSQRKGIHSVSNDGYSESYSQVSEEQLANEMRMLITNCLSGTGLVGAY